MSCITASGRGRIAPIDDDQKGSHIREHVPTAGAAGGKGRGVDSDVAEAVEAEIIRYARERLSGIETPERVESIDALPKASTGKVRKNILRELF